MTGDKLIEQLLKKFELIYYIFSHSNFPTFFNTERISLTSILDYDNCLTYKSIITLEQQILGPQAGGEDLR